MNRNIKAGMTCALLGVLGISSCKKFLNVNTNPNVSQTATVQTLLPAAQLILASSVGVDLEIDGSIWGQFWTQSPAASQYIPLDQYSPTPDQFSIPWQNLYSAGENFYQLYKLADSQKQVNYMAISLLMKAYTFQLITDGWGNVPFTQALKGQAADGGITSPKYDSQMVVYNGILAEIDSADSLITVAAANGNATPGSDDLIYGGAMTKWQKFANTLQLRILLRMAYINPTAAQSGVASLFNSGAQFLGVGDDAFIGYGYNSNNRNPLFAEEVGLAYTQNLVGSATCIDSMLSNNDPRINIFYEPSGSGSYVGLLQGNHNVAYTAGEFSIPSQYVAGDAQNAGSADAPVNLLTSYESLFLQAEAAARGWAGAGTDSSLYFQAISANFNYYNAQFNSAMGITGSAALAAYLTGGGNWVNYPTSGSVTSKLQYIITQKWFSMCGNQGFEAWTEWRRTGYPNFFTVSATSLIGANFPERFTYPTVEQNSNANFPGLAPLTEKVWWDVHP